MKIAFFEADAREEKYFRENLKLSGKHKAVYFKGELNERNVEKVKDVDVLVVFIHSSVNKEILKKMPKLKYITTMSTGFDHIDIAECKYLGIKISNVPFYGENTVAEHAFGLILTLSRKLYWAIERTKRDDFSLSGLEGFDLKGRTLGVIGPGHIGQHVIRMARGFEMKVLAYSPFVDKKLEKKLGFTYVSLNELLKKSDIITLHAPLNGDTRHMINMSNIKLIKRDAFLINTARGGLIETGALKYALDNGILAGAALDVLEGEDTIAEEAQLLKNGKKINEEEWKTFIRNHLLLKDKNVVVTPHNAFYSREAVCRILDTTIDNISAFLKGKVKNRVK